MRIAPLNNNTRFCGTLLRTKPLDIYIKMLSEPEFDKFVKDVTEIGEVDDGKVFAIKAKEFINHNRDQQSFDTELRGYLFCNGEQVNKVGQHLDSYNKSTKEEEGWQPNLFFGLERLLQKMFDMYDLGEKRHTYEYLLKLEAKKDAFLNSLPESISS